MLKDEIEKKSIKKMNLFNLSYPNKSIIWVMRLEKHFKK
jgi:hypothetical protein